MLDDWEILEAWMPQTFDFAGASTDKVSKNCVPVSVRDSPPIAEHAISESDPSGWAPAGRSSPHTLERVRRVFEIDVDRRLQ